MGNIAYSGLDIALNKFSIVVQSTYIFLIFLKINSENFIKIGLVFFHTLHNYTDNFVWIFICEQWQP